MAPLGAILLVVTDGAQVAVGEGRGSDRSRFRAAETACAASRVQVTGRGANISRFLLTRAYSPRPAGGNRLRRFRPILPSLRFGRMVARR